MMLALDKVGVLTACAPCFAAAAAHTSHLTAAHLHLLISAARVKRGHTRDDTGHN